MSIEIKPNEEKMDLSKLGQFYSPIEYIEYGHTQAISDINEVPPINPKLSKKLENYFCSPNIINNKKKLKVKFKKIYSKDSNSFIKKANNSYNISSRNDNNNMNEITTTISTINTNTNSSTMDETNKLMKLKELMICFLCHEKIVKPKVCPKCFKIFCEECVQKWFINYKIGKCYYCNQNISLDDMINIPIINNISNILNKKTCDIKTDSSLVFKKLSSRISKIYKSKSKTNNIIDSSRSNISCYTATGNLVTKSPNNSLDIRNCLQKLNYRKFPNSISGPKRTKNFTKGEPINYEHCPIHKDQILYYYCFNCEKSYCRTCFVFFGEEKNKHIGHKIIDYDKLKERDNFELLKQIRQLKENSDKISGFINKCEKIKNCYNFEREMVNNYIKSLINKYNEKIEKNIKLINDLINNYKKYIEQINKERENIQKYYSGKTNINDKTEINLFNDVTKLNKLCFLKIDNEDVFANLSPKLLFNIYNTDLKSFDIKDKHYRFKVKLNNSKYNLVVLKKEKEIQIYIYYTIEKEKEIPKKTFIFPYIYLKKSINNWEIFELKESLTYNGNHYFIRRFNPENFCDINSCIKIKGILYESFFV